MAELERIAKLVQTCPGWSRVTFTTGEVVDLEWQRFARKGTVFARLSEPEYANLCQVVEGGFGLRWPDGMDWSAGAVLQAGQPVADVASPNGTRLKPAAVPTK